MEDNAEISKKFITRDHPTKESTTLARVEKGKEVESSIHELIKGMEDLQLSFAKLEKIESSSQEKPKSTKRKLHAYGVGVKALNDPL